MVFPAGMVVAIPCLREAAAHPEHDVGLRQEVVDRAGHHAAAAGAERQRVVLRERALALERGHDRSLQELGQLEELGAASAYSTPWPGVDHGSTRLHQHARRRRDVARIAGRAGGLHRPVLQRHLIGDLGDGHVGGDLDHDRSGPAHLQEIEGPAHDLRDLLGLVQRLHPLGDRGVRARRAEEREDLGAIALVAERQHEDRHRIGVRRGDAREGVLGAGSVLHREHAEAPAVGDPAEAVGDADADALLAAEHRSDAGGGRGVDDRCRRIRAQELHALALHDLGDRVDDFHRSLSFRGLDIYEGLEASPRACRPNCSATRSQLSAAWCEAPCTSR